jgi:site-specific DNA recombinase
MAHRSSSTASIYENIPESKVTLTILGTVAEFERAKIIERMMRGKLHRLQKGEMIGGQAPHGYEHVCKTADRPATLAPKGPEATIVRALFEKFDSGMSLVGLSRWLQASEIKTRFGKTLWQMVQSEARALPHCAPNQLPCTAL